MSIDMTKAEPKREPLSDTMVIACARVAIARIQPDEWIATDADDFGLALVCYPNRDANAAFIAACNPAAIRELLAERDALLDALEIMLIGAYAVGVPHAGERKVLQEAVDNARAVIAATRKE